jgi:hypothetical protein
MVSKGREGIGVGIGEGGKIARHKKEQHHWNYLD